MINLQKISGLPILFDEKKFNLIFSSNFSAVEKSERSLEELKPYLKNPDIKNWLNPVYRVWRNVHLESDNKKINDNNLRYDLTLLPPGIMGEEFVKTAGHYHKPYPEVYEVLMGRAYFLTQSEFAVYLAEAGPTEKFIIPPEFGHNTINVFNEPLLLANWVSNRAVYDYDAYKNNKGAAYYFLKNNDLIDIVKNPNYKATPEIKKNRIKEWPEFGLVKNRPLYSLANDLEKLKFLNYPEEFTSLGW